ncbi:leukocyte elastase inhibitor-like [Paramacrobiotus metropolitanus]|uniref:leukocyte elastase inhibitor-like n=1 Tax=Paramacrobiotus metropolitanus TaxID=2943436 RepID=UPI002445D6B6|nr:leukocyte elastase inhibitor-like [Paramacrobiotus metropolitanus]
MATRQSPRFKRKTPREEETTPTPEPEKASMDYESDDDSVGEPSAEDIAKCDVYALNGTTSRLYKSIIKQHKAENLVVCPIAIFNDLHLAYLLSKGQTKDELQKAFFGFDQQLDAKSGVSTGSKGEGLQANVQQIQRLASTGSGAKNAPFQLLTEGMLVVSSHLELSTKNNLVQVDWNDKDAARSKINRQLQGKTEKRVAELVKTEHIPGKNNSGLLVSAARFSANWESKFLSKSRTAYAMPSRDFMDGLPMSMEDFHNADGSVKKVLTVHLEEKIMLTRDEDLKVTILELPFKKYAMNMIVVLPDDTTSNGLRHFEENINHQTFEILQKNAQMPLTRVYLPKFNVDSEVSLNKSLTDIGVKHLFDAGGLFSSNTDWADLTSSGDALTHITDVLHGASFSVSGECDAPAQQNKSGSKKAKRDDGNDTNGNIPPQCVQLESARFATGMHINRPFFFMVQSSWPTIWSFMGHVQHLEEADSAVWRHLTLP